MLLEYLAGESGIALLDVNPGLLIWTTTTFLIVMVVLKIFAWKPISKALDERAEKIHADIDRAEAIKNEAEKRLLEYEEKLNGLREEGQEIIAESRRDAEGLKQELLDSSQKEAEAIKARGLRDIQLATDKALEDYNKNITDLSIEIAGRIIRKTLSAEDHKALVADSIEEIRSMK